MKSVLSISLLVALAATQAHAQGTRIWRCAGNTYTNDAQQAQAQGCKPMEGGNVTVVEGTKVNGAATTKVVANTSSAGARERGEKVDSADQKARDADARKILEDELRKAEARQAELQKEYNNGEPEKMGPEHRNHQKYLDRVAEMKANLTRVENDIAGLRRELGRFSGSAASASK